MIYDFVFGPQQYAEDISAAIDSYILRHNRSKHPDTNKILKHIILKIYGSAFMFLNTEECMLLCSKLDTFSDSCENDITQQKLRSIIRIESNEHVAFAALLNKKHISEQDVRDLSKAIGSSEIARKATVIDNYSKLMGPHKTTWNLPAHLHHALRIARLASITAQNKKLYILHVEYLKMCAKAYLSAAENDSSMEYETCAPLIFKTISCFSVTTSIIATLFNTKSSRRNIWALRSLVHAIAEFSQGSCLSTFFDKQILMSAASLSGKQTVRPQYKNRDILLSEIVAHSKTLYESGSKDLHHEMARECYDKFVTPRIHEYEVNLKAKKLYPPETIKAKIVEFKRRHVPAFESVKKAVGKIAAGYGLYYDPSKK